MSKDSDFCKLFLDDDGRQILVTIDTNEKCNPCVLIKFVPKGLGVCSVGASWDSDSDEDWDKAELYFNSITRVMAINIATEIITKMNSLGDPS